MTPQNVHSTAENVERMFLKHHRIPSSMQVYVMQTWKTKNLVPWCKWV